MNYTLTSAEANKLLKKLLEEKDIILNDEEESKVFQAANGEDIESVRPEYDYETTQVLLAGYNEKIRKLKHAINCFNTTQVVEELGMTIDEVLVYIPQLTKHLRKISDMARTMPKSRVTLFNTSHIIDYNYTNYDVKKAKEDNIRVMEELSKVQTALDLVNNTVTFEVELPD